MKKLKLPKRPKQSSPISVLEKHLAAVKETEKKFAAKLSAAKKVAAAKKADSTRRHSLNEQITKERAAYTRMK